MLDNFQQVREYLITLGFTVLKEFPEELTLSVENEILKNVIIFVDNDTLVIKTPVLHFTTQPSSEAYRKLLLLNDKFVHGALVLNENGRVDFKDTLHLATMDFEELESSINSLSLFLDENLEELIQISQNEVVSI